MNTLKRPHLVRVGDPNQPKTKLWKGEKIKSQDSD